MRAHWFALPLLGALTGLTREGVLEVRLEEGAFHLRVGGGAGSALTAAEPLAAVYGYGPADRPDARIVLDAETCLELARGGALLAEAVKDGRVEVLGEGPLAAELRGA